MKTSDNNKKLSSEIVSFLKKTDAAEYVSVPNNLDFQEFLNNKMLLVFAIRKGLPYSIFSLIQDNTPFNLNEWSEFLNISNKSLQRYKAKNSIFKPLYTEKIFELAEVVNKGVDVFGDVEKLKQWLETENYALGNLKPIELLKDSYGKELVLSELTRIDHGILV